MDIFTPAGATIEPAAGVYANYNKQQRELHAGRVKRPIFELPNLTATALASLAAGDPVCKEIAASGLQSIFMENDGDAYVHSWPVPPDCDPTQELEMNIKWSQEDGVTGSCLWTIKYLPVVMGVTTLATPTTVLDTPLVNQADLAADIPQLTNWGKIDAGKAGVTTLRPGIDEILFLFEATTLTVITDAALIAAYIIYSRRFNG